jgi:hypothetical protein
MAGAEPALRPTGEPPPGFEAFFEEQRTIVDVYYAGRFLLSTPARYDLDHIRFDDPAAVAAAVPDAVDTAAIAAALGGELDPHVEAICGRAERDDCGRLTPQVAAVIFDASRFRATLFVAPDQRVTQGPDLRRFLPPSDSGFSVLQNLFASVSGADSASPDAYTVSALTSLSWAESHLLVETSWDSENDLTMDQAYARREFEGRVAQGGLYRTRGQSLGFVRERDLLGARLGSSLDTRADRAFSGGTPLEVFLPTRSRVELLQDGRLIDSSTYDAGNQVLDTRDLPDGAYEVEIRIRGADGSVRTERRLFVKTTRLPPKDQPLWNLEAGRVLDRTASGVVPQDADAWFARASTTRRIEDDLGVDLGMAAGAGDVIGQAGVFRVGALGEIQASAFAGTDDLWGAALLGRVQWRALRLNLDYRRIEGTERDAGSLVGAASEQIGATLSTPLAGGTLTMGARRDSRAGTTDRSSWTLSWDRYLLRGRRSALRLQFDVSQEDDDWFALARLEWDLRGEGGVRALVQPGVRHDRRDGRGKTGRQTDARLAWERESDRGDYLSLGVDGTDGAREQRVGTDALYEGRLGRLQADVDHSFDADRTSWTGNFNTTVLSDGDRLSVGGRDQARSAALVEIRGDVPDARFEVLVDGYAEGVAPAGSVTPIHLTPWRTYTVRLRPVGSALLAWENREEQITLYPGNVVRLGWDVAEIVVLLGRVVDAAGEPVEQATVEGAYGFAVTERGGFLQAEVVRPAGDEPLELELRRRDASPCTVRVPAADAGAQSAMRGILRVGTLRCRTGASGSDRGDGQREGADVGALGGREQLRFRHGDAQLGAAGAAAGRRARVRAVGLHGLAPRIEPREARAVVELDLEGEGVHALLYDELVAGPLAAGLELVAPPVVVAVDAEAVTAGHVAGPGEDPEVDVVEPGHLDEIRDVDTDAEVLGVGPEARRGQLEAALVAPGDAGGDLGRVDADLEPGVEPVRAAARVTGLVEARGDARLHVRGGAGAQVHETDVHDHRVAAVLVLDQELAAADPLAIVDACRPAQGEDAEEVGLDAEVPGRGGGTAARRPGPEAEVVDLLDAHVRGRAGSERREPGEQHRDRPRAHAARGAVRAGLSVGGAVHFDAPGRVRARAGPRPLGGRDPRGGAISSARRPA